MITESPLKIFFCDESSATCELIGRRLGSIPGLNVCGYARTVALSLNAIREYEPDVVIAGLKFNDGYGLDLLHRFGDEGLEPVVVILSTQPAALLRAVCIAAGAHYYCEQETQLDRLGDLVESLTACRSLLRRNRQRARLAHLAFGSLDEGIAVAGGDGQLLWSSPAYNRLLGLNSEEVVGRPHPLLQDRTDGAMWACLSAGQPWRVERRERRHVGEDFQAAHCVTPVRTATGKPIQFVCSLREVTDRPPPAESSAPGLALLDQAGDYIFQADLAGNVTYWNRPAEALFGPFTVDTGQPLLARCCAANQQDLLAAALRQAHTQSWRGEVSLHNDRNRDVHVLDLRISGVRDPRGETCGLLLVGRPVFEGGGPDDARSHSQRMETIGTLATGIVHDMNNILSPIALTVGALQHTATDPQSRECIRLIGDCVERGRQLVRQVLNYSRNTGLEPELVSVTDLTAEVVRLARHTFPGTIRVEEAIEPAPHLVKGIPPQLHQVLLNLAINARDAMPRGGTLRLAVENVSLGHEDLAGRPGAVPGAWVAVHLSDTGEGIPPDVLPHIWERFFTTKPRDQGTGLGLPTVRSIVDYHHGFIEVATRVGHGTTFSVFLPAAAPAAPFVGATHDGDGRCVLIVTVEMPDRDPLVQTLRGANFQVLWAKDAATALQLCRAHLMTIRLLVVDRDHPHLDVTALRHEASVVLPHLPVLQVGGLPAAGDEGPVLTKPIQADTLLVHAHRLMQVEPAIQR